MGSRFSGRSVGWQSDFKMLLSNMLLGLAGILFLLADTGPLMAREPWTHQPPVNGRKDSKPWREVVGKRVAVEGIAWGSYEKGIGEYVILNREKVYIRNANFLNIKAHGKLVRVVGVLERISFQNATPYAQSVAPGTVAYFIRPEKLEIIDHVEWPWMKVVPHARRSESPNPRH